MTLQKEKTSFSYTVEGEELSSETTASQENLRQKMMEVQQAESYLSRCIRELANENSRVRDIVVSFSFQVRMLCVDSCADRSTRTHMPNNM